jgi:allophanate hydrolase
VIQRDVIHRDSVGSLDSQALRNAYVRGDLTPERVVAAVYDRIADQGEDHVWISLVPREEALARANALAVQYSGDDPLPPLYGLPFAVKDNIDVAGMATTAAYPRLSTPVAVSAALVDRLVAAGAILVGKTNLDQFATGLNGTRSPYGTPRNPFDAALIPGGSSSGSAVAVSAGLVTFAIGTDTAGSGRVPAAYTNTVGLKPSRGLVSSRGLLPACRSLDCPSVFALTVADGSLVLSIIASYDALDPWSRKLPAPAASPLRTALDGLRIAIPQESDLGFPPGSSAASLYKRFLSMLSEMGADLEPIPMSAFFEAGARLYAGAWVAERFGAVAATAGADTDDIDPVVLDAIEIGRMVAGSQVFADQHRMRELRREIAPLWDRCSALLTPTVITAFTIEEMAADPIGRNAQLGRFTTYGNLLDLAAIALPAGFTAEGLPFGITLAGPAGSDGRLAAIASAMENLIHIPMGATGVVRPASTGPEVGDQSGAVLVAVVGAHLAGMPLNRDLVALGAVLESVTTTAPCYRLFALPNSTPPKPGLLRCAPGDSTGAAVEVEVYWISAPSLGVLLTSVKAPLAIGSLELADGRMVHGFVCEPYALADATDITAFGGWRAYRAAAIAQVADSAMVARS